ncbi:MAG: DUF3293 domain-containing protein [Bacteroidetes bacterium]|nr:MAG: DUF3293 domain-containing protein [Bacteroidota bacterium]
MSKPFAVLTRLEDSPPTLDRRLVIAYLRTIYRVVEPAFDITIGPLQNEVKNWLQHRSLDTFCFITAANPGSQLLSEAENEVRNKALRRLLTTLVGEGLFPAFHLSASGDWPAEAGWWVPGLSAADGIRLGKMFDQNAIVFWQSGRLVELWWL